MSDELQLGINKTILQAMNAQQSVNEAIARGLAAITLMSDRYDVELAEIREGLASLDYRLRNLETPGGLHSVGVSAFRCTPDESGGMRDEQ